MADEQDERTITEQDVEAPSHPSLVMPSSEARVPTPPEHDLVTESVMSEDWGRVVSPEPGDLRGVVTETEE